MQSAFTFPVFLLLGGKHILLAGLGKTGIRKLRKVLAANPASVMVVDLKPKTDLSPAGQELLNDRRVAYMRRSCTAEDIGKSFLVFAATNSRTENIRIAKLCAKFNVLCNSVSDPDNGSFIVPASVHRGDLCVAVSSGGENPALAKKWRLEQENWLEKKLRFNKFMGAFRRFLLANSNDSAANGRLLNKIANSPLEAWLEAGEKERCSLWLQAELPSELRKHVGEVLDDFT